MYRMISSLSLSRLSISNLSLSSLSEAALFGSLLAVSAFTGITPAAANPAENQIISGFCVSHPQTDECNAWRVNGAGWGEAQYQSFYDTHVGTDEFSTPEAKEAFGKSDTGPVPGAEGTPAVGAPVYSSQDANTQAGTGQSGDAPATEVIGDSPNHVADCQASFKSYNPSTDTYVGLDGETRKCKL